jgi:hypothetical protein
VCYTYSAYQYLDTFVNAWVEVHSRFLQIFCSFFVSFPLTLTVTCFYWHFFPLMRFLDYGPGCHQHQSEKTHQTDPSLKIQTLSLSIITRNIYCFIMKQNVYNNDILLKPLNKNEPLAIHLRTFFCLSFSSNSSIIGISKLQKIWTMITKSCWQL